MHSLDLVKLFLEQSPQPKAIIMAGGGGAGKSYVLGKLDISGIQVFNPDTYVEKQDIPLAAASSMVDKEVQQAVKEKENFIWDTTAGNPSKVQSIVDAGYDVAMVMVYTHPVISLLSNFDRKRSLPVQSVFSTWKASYSLVETYREMLGENFYFVPNLREEKFKKEIESFNRAARQGSRGIQKFIDDLINSNPETYRSSFSKPFELEDKEALEAYEEEVKDLDFDREDEGMVKNLKKHFNKFWEKRKLPPTGSMEKKVAAIERDRKRSEEQSKEVATAISNMLSDRTFQDIVSSGDSIEDVKSEIKNFLKY